MNTKTKQIDEEVGNTLYVADIIEKLNDIMLRVGNVEVFLYDAESRPFIIEDIGVGRDYEYEDMSMYPFRGKKVFAYIMGG